MRLPREDYRKAVGFLKRYNYNCITVLSIKDDILSIGSAPITDMPRVPYGVGNTTLMKVIELEENEHLQKSLREIKIVNNALLLISNDSQKIFDELYRKGTPRWDIIDKMHVSEETYKRRKRELIYTVAEEMKKLIKS